MNNGDVFNSATQLMAMEFILELLATTSPRTLGETLTEHLRELCGARMAMVMVHRPEPEYDELLHISPQRRFNLLTPAELNHFCFEKIPEELPCVTAGLARDHPLKHALERAGISTMARFELRAGGELVGSLLLFDLPGVERIDEIKQLIAIIAAPIALALKNALAFAQIERQSQELERRVAERTAELERKHAILEQSERRLRTIIQTAMDGFWLLDLDGRLLEVNHAYCRMSGFDAAELLGMAVSDLDLNDTPDKLRVHVEYIRKTGYDRFDSRHRRKDGSIMDVEVSVQYHDFENGQFAVFIRDTTERRRSEAFRAMGQEMLSLLSQADSESEAIYRIVGLLKNTSGVDAVGIRLQHEDDFPYFFQQGFSAGFLAKENSLVRRNREGGICLDDRGRPSLECTCGLVISGRTDPASPLCTRGGSFWTNDSSQVLHMPESEDPRTNPRNECIHQGYASVALVPVRAKGSIVGLLQLNALRKGCFSLEMIETLERVAENIGEAMLRKRAEEEKRNLQAHFQHAQKMESVGRLAGGVAHDFNNLLTVILGHAQIMLMELSSDDPMYQGLLEISRAAERSGELTRQLLAFARKQTISPSSQNLNHLIGNLLKMLRRLIGEDIQLTWQPADELWQVQVDPSQIDQILANLCVNARDAIANVGKITIETGNITFDREFCLLNPGFSPGEYVLLVVSDNGCGMDRETLSHMFEPFFTTKEVGKGTGLGLATIYGIVKQNNGFIKAYSELGHGTTFKIYLPRYGNGEQPAQEKPVPHPVLKGRETILLVEDEMAILHLVSELLKRQGYNVLAAGTPAEALKIAAEHADHIELLITDTIMPEMNGKELAEAVTSLCPGIRRLYMSGYTASVIAHHGVLDQGVHFISKPFLLPDLAAKVREVLESKP